MIDKVVQFLLPYKEIIFLIGASYGLISSLRYFGKLKQKRRFVFDRDFLYAAFNVGLGGSIVSLSLLIPAFTTRAFLPMLCNMIFFPSLLIAVFTISMYFSSLTMQQ